VRFRRRSPNPQSFSSNKIQEFGVGSQFRILYDRIETPGVKQRTETQAISNFVLNLFYDPPFETA